MYYLQGSFTSVSVGGRAAIRARRFHSTAIVTTEQAWAEPLGGERSLRLGLPAAGSVDGLRARAVMDHATKRRMSAVLTTAVAALSGVAAVATLFAYLYVVRRSDLVAAREEAVALAETRRQVIRELRERLTSVDERHKRAKAEAERRIRELQGALDRTRAQARKDAYQTQHFYAVALSDLLGDLLVDLERTPPDVEAALVRIRKLHAPERPATSRGSAIEN